MEWIIGIIGGALGGVGSGAAVKQNKLGPIINGILGAVGGAGGSLIVQNLLSGGLDIAGDRRQPGRRRSGRRDRVDRRRPDRQRGQEEVALDLV